MTRFLLIALAIVFAIPRPTAADETLPSQFRLSTVSAESGKRLTVVVTDQEVAVDNATPGADVLVVGYVRSLPQYNWRYHRHRMLTPADRAGTVRMTPARGAGPDALWIAVDVSTGEVAIGTPDTKPARHTALGRDKLRKDTNGRLKKAELDAPLSYAVLVRPGVGAWELTTGDGGLRDDDGMVDGTTLASLHAFKAVRGSEAPPDEFLKGDVLLVLSPEDLSLVSGRIE